MGTPSIAASELSPRVNLMMKQSPYILPSPGSANGFINTRPRAMAAGEGSSLPWVRSEQAVH